MSTAALIWYRSGGAEVSFALSADILTVGRDEDVDIRVDEPLVSRLHARIERRDDGGWIVRDLGSTNRTRVNDEMIRGECPLEDGDQIQFGRARCVFYGAADGRVTEPMEVRGHSAPDTPEVPDTPQPATSEAEGEGQQT